MAQTFATLTSTDDTGQAHTISWFDKHTEPDKTGERAISVFCRDFPVTPGQWPYATVSIDVIQGELRVSVNNIKVWGST